MQFQLPTKTLLALLPFFIAANAQASGTGTTTRYWDCCKPSCAWSGKAALASGATPVLTCDINDTPLSSSLSVDAVSGCSSGTSYMCSDEAPWAVSNDLAYGYAAVNIAGGSESSWCCACYELTFTSGAAAGKKMIVQATNTGGDLSSNQFDLSVCLNYFYLSHTSANNLIDPWWRCRNLQWLHSRMGGAKFRLGRSIWRGVRCCSVCYVSYCPSIWMRLAF